MSDNQEIKKLKKELKIKEELIKQQGEAFLSLQTASQYLTSEVNIEELLTHIATEVGKFLEAKFVTFWLLEDNKKFLYVKAAYGMSKLHIQYARGPGHLSLNDGWVGRAVRDKKFYFTENTLADPHCPKRWVTRVFKLSLHSLFCLPIIQAGKAEGGLCAYWTKPRKFRDFETRLLSVVANQAATAIRDVENYQKLRKKINELEKFQRLTIGRELKLVELKKEIAKLRKESKK